jgi:dUTP pyrophosphatase
MKVGVKAIREGVQLPTYGTERSACADIRANIYSSGVRRAPGPNAHTDYEVHTLIVHPGERVLIPTGLIFDIPEGYSLRVHPRSGLSFKAGLTVVCGEGVIDEDYQNELFVPIINHSTVDVAISDGDRIAQIELVKDERCSFTFIEELSDKYSSREGGFGHTGTR